MEEKIELLEKNVETISITLKEFRSSTVSFLNRITDILGSLQKEVRDLDIKLKSLDTTTATGLNDVGSKIQTLSDEISKIGEVTGYDDIYKNSTGLN